MNELPEIKDIFDPLDFCISKKDETIFSIVFQLEDERKKQNISQRKLSKLSNVSQGQLSRIENLESVPTLETLFKIANALGKKLVLA